MGDIKSIAEHEIKAQTLYLYDRKMGRGAVTHVLIIEDETRVANQLEELAREFGATSVDRATTELDAICAGLKRPPDVILSDVRLAAGTGPCAVSEICRYLGRVPVVYVTASPDECECQYAHIVLHKPVGRQAILDALASATVSKACTLPLSSSGPAPITIRL